MTARQPPRLKSPLVSFLAEFLTQRAEAEGGFPPLAGRITSAYLANLVDAGELGKDKVINRQKLTNLAKGDRAVKLSFQELEALHCYLVGFGRGLDQQPLFRLPTIVQALSTSRSATFLLGSHMSDDGSYLSHFDVLAMIEIQRVVNRLGVSVPFDIFDVHGTERKQGEEARPWDRVFHRYGPSAICIASPRANQATEHALRMILGVEKGRTPWGKLPFYFVWSGLGTNRQRSRFARPVAEIEDEHADLAAHVEQKKGWGLIAGGAKFMSDLSTTRKTGTRRLLSHGVIAAQRQREGQIWVVVAGLSGPGTYLAARCLEDMRGFLPPKDDPLAQAVLWGVVKGHVTTDPMIEKGQLPLVEEPRFVVGPSLWDPAHKAPAVPPAVGPSEGRTQ